MQIIQCFQRKPSCLLKIKCYNHQLYSENISRNEKIFKEMINLKKVSTGHYDCELAILKC